MAVVSTFSWAEPEGDHRGVDSGLKQAHRVAAPRALHQRLVVLRTPLLRPQDQEIHDGEDRDERRELHQHVGRTRGSGAGGLGEG